jgi:hypothetical protein
MKKLYLALTAALLATPAARADSEFSVVLQGGAARYNQSLSSGVDTGPEFGARLGILPLPILGIELGYLGTQNNVNANSDVGRASSTLRTNAGYGDLRFNVLPGALTPYVFGGLGITWVTGATASGIPDRSVGMLPFGGGLEANVGQFKIGGRFQYNYLFEKIYRGNGGLLGTGINADKGGNSDLYGVSVDLGATFQ